MDKEINFESLAETINVQQSVLELLYELVPYKDSFLFLTNTTRLAEFWSLVDSLPSHINLQIHSADATILCNDHDFPPDTLAPYFQDFWVSLNLAQNNVANFNNAYAFTQFLPEHIGLILSDSEGWTKTEENNQIKYIFGGTYEFSEYSLCCMCDSYVSDSRPWLFCDYDDIRSAYLDCDRIISKIEISTTNVLTKLRQFKYATNEEFVKDVKGMTISYNVSKFNLPADLLEALSNLMGKSADFLHGKRNVPSVTECEDWTKSRAVNLDEQMKLPFEQRRAFVETSSILQARSGQPVDSPFEKNSVAELLFCNNNGDVMPLPYISGKAEIQSSSSIPFVHSAFRKFVARQLMESGYTSTTDSVVDILADVSQFMVKKFAQDAIAIKNRSTASTRDIMNQALSTNSFDVQTMMANPHIPRST